MDGHCFCNSLGSAELSKLAFLPEDTEGSSKVEPPPSGYHLRYTLKDVKYKLKAKMIAEDYVARWKPTKYIFAYELSDKGVPHVHATLIMDDFKSSTMSDWWKQYKCIMPPTAAYFHEKLKDRLKSEAYCVKNNCIILSNYTEQEIEEVKNAALLIKENMKMPVVQKICKILDETEHYQKKFPCEMFELKYMICGIYTNLWDKPIPPNYRLISIQVAMAGGYVDDLNIMAAL